MPQRQTSAASPSLTPRALLSCEGDFCRDSQAGLGSETCAPKLPGVFDLPGSEAGALLQSWAGIGSAPPRTDDPRPQPGTIGYEGGPVCTRVLSNGQVVLLPGCRDPSDPAYDPITGGANPGTVVIGFPAGVAGIPALGNPALGPIIFTQGHPFTGQPWQSESAAFSWNLQMLLVAASLGAPNDPAAFDAAQAYRIDACSYVLPASCHAVEAVRSLAVAPLAGGAAPGDPAPPRWLWQQAASFRVTEATGDFEALAGGLLHAAGPLRSDLAGAEAMVAFFVTPPEIADADADGVDAAKDRCPLRADAAQEDGDADRVGDACDVCLRHADPLQRDTDGDGFGNRCDADLDNDGRVGLRDFALLRARLFTRDPHADLDGDGRVAFGDLVLLRRLLFQPPGPAAAQ